MWCKGAQGMRFRKEGKKRFDKAQGLRIVCLVQVTLLNMKTLRQAVAANRKANSIYSRIWRKLDRQARTDRCAGDIVCGWDWPTLRTVMPVEYAALVEQIRIAKESAAMIHALFQIPA